MKLLFDEPERAITLPEQSGKTKYAGVISLNVSLKFGSLRSASFVTNFFSIRQNQFLSNWS